MWDGALLATRQMIETITQSLEIYWISMNRLFDKNTSDDDLVSQDNLSNDDSENTKDEDDIECDSDEQNKLLISYGVRGSRRLTDGSTVLLPNMKEIEERVKGGTIRASDTFPGDRHLIELWSQDSPKLEKDYIPHHGNIFDRRDQNFAIRYEGITFRDILFDSGYRGGGLYVIDSARIRITSCFFVHFSTEGVLVQRGHETFISDTFLGQHPTIGGDRGERDFSGIAIDLASNDNAITDVTIFSSAIGIVLRGEANIVTGVHCYNKATYFGGVGILVKASQNRIDNCYLDYNSIVIEDPFLVHISNGYFLGDGNVVLKAINGRIFGLNVINNMFSGNPSKMTPILNLDGQFTDIDQVVIDQNNVNGMSLRSTAGKLTVAGNGTSWVADFSSVLVFPNKINHVQYSFYSRGGVAGFPAHAVTNVSSNVVVIESEKPVDGVVSVFVDQHNIVGERNFLM
ncbi:PREDICTED: polygalacturonase QRT3-like [Nicotiana attenuata]|uniref:polygalacturonase QRT3-like n=1 Tax=Nicotiana attenuata TaxID=49451 RepID=UPI0009052AEA|nr:PREDICTED: polygalacturonase QRT3-like [Nicotiana attenuata]